MPSIDQMMSVKPEPLGPPIRPVVVTPDPATTWERVRDEHGRPTVFERNGKGEMRTVDMTPPAQPVVSPPPRTAVEVVSPRTAVEVVSPRTAVEVVSPRTAVEDEMNRFPIGSRWVYETPYDSAFNGLLVAVEGYVASDPSFVQVICEGKHYGVRKAWLKPVPFPIGSRWAFDPPYPTATEWGEAVVVGEPEGYPQLVRVISDGLYHTVRKDWLKPIKGTGE